MLLHYICPFRHRAVQSASSQTHLFPGITCLDGSHPSSTGIPSILGPSQTFQCMALKQESNQFLGQNLRPGFQRPAAWFPGSTVSPNNDTPLIALCLSLAGPFLVAVGTSVLHGPTNVLPGSATQLPGEHGKTSSAWVLYPGDSDSGPGPLHPTLAIPVFRPPSSWALSILLLQHLEASPLLMELTES